MAQRKTGKPKSGGGRARRGAEKSAPKGETARLTELERERDGLRAELASARERITTLETQRRQAVDRIDWVIDSLQHMVESGV